MSLNTTPRILLTGVILELTLATAIIHFTLGGTLFLLNAAGYLALAAAYLVAAVMPMPAVRRLSWLPRAGLAAFASVTIGTDFLRSSGAQCCAASRSRPRATRTS